MLHKPAGTECSQKPSTYPSIYTLLPSPLRLRPNKGAVQGVQAIGRLDQDTTGLLLLTDDGQFIHRMGSPKHHVPKVYEVTTKHPVDEAQIDRLLAGVVLDDDPKPVRAAACEADRPAAAAADARPKASTTRSSACWRRWATGSRRCTARASAHWRCRTTWRPASGAG